MLLKDSGETFCLLNYHYVHVYAVSPLKRPGLFDPVTSWWSDYECWRLFFMPTPIILPYYLNLVLTHRDSELIMCTAVSELFVCTLVFLFLSALVVCRLLSAVAFLGMKILLFAMSSYYIPEVLITLYNLLDSLQSCPIIRWVLLIFIMRTFGNSRLIGLLNVSLADIHTMPQQVRLAMYLLALLETRSGLLMDYLSLIRLWRFPNIMEMHIQWIFVKRAVLLWVLVVR